MQLMAEVQAQFERVNRELDIQLKRMAQIQMELDQVRARLRR